MSDEYEKWSVAEQLRAGLADSLAHSKGQLSLRTTTLPHKPPRAKARDVRSLRHRLRMSQTLFAATLNVTTKTVQSWEQGARAPSDAALRMLEVIGRQPAVVDAILAAGVRPLPARVAAMKHAATKHPRRKSVRSR